MPTAGTGTERTFCMSSRLAKCLPGAGDPIARSGVRVAFGVQGNAGSLRLGWVPGQDWLRPASSLRNFRMWPTVAGHYSEYGASRATPATTMRCQSGNRPASNAG